MHPNRRICIAALLGGALPGFGVLAQPAAAEKSPLPPSTPTPSASSLPTTANTPTTADEVWPDPARRRDIPVKIRWPDATVQVGPRPVVIFSHGLGGTTDGGAVWGEAWSAAGLVVLHVQHAGSDLAAVRAVASSFADQRALQSVANAQQFIARMADVVFVLDELGRRQAARAGRWAGVRPTAVGMSGHSFGAQTTLAMAGQRFPGYLGLDEPRLASFVAFSPAVPLQMAARRSFEPVDRPVLSITGTLDGDVVGVGNTAERRRQVFGALPAGHKAHLVLNDADHMSFAGQTGRAAEIIPREQATRNLQAAHHALVARITTDWWLATLSADVAAQERLRQPAGLLPGDVWERG